MSNRIAAASAISLSKDEVSLSKDEDEDEDNLAMTSEKLHDISSMRERYLSMIIKVL